MPTVLLVLTVAAVLGIIVMTWRPWDAGAQGRITASGLTPVLTLMLGQLGTWVVSSNSTDQALSLRRLELESERQRSDRAAERESAARVEAKTVADALEVRERFLEVLRATSKLGPALTTATTGNTPEPQIPSAEFAAARVAVLELIPLAGDPYSDMGVGLRNVLKQMDGLYAADDWSSFFDAVKEVLSDLVRLEILIAESEALA